MLPYVLYVVSFVDEENNQPPLRHLTTSQVFLGYNKTQHIHYTFMLVISRQTQKRHAYLPPPSLPIYSLYFSRLGERLIKNVYCSGSMYVYGQSVLEEYYFNSTS